MDFLYCGAMYIFIITFFSFFLVALSVFISKKVRLNREKLSAFECGFDPLSNPRSTFSLRFFLLAVIFLIFDVEIILIIPYIYSVSFLMGMNCVFYMLVFMVVLLVGLIHELNEGSLEWAY